MHCWVLKTIPTRYFTYESKEILSVILPIYEYTKMKEDLHKTIKEKYDRNPDTFSPSFYH